MLLLCACCSFGLIREPFHFYSYSCTHMHCYLRRKLHERKNWLPEAKVSANFLSSSPANRRTGSGLASRNFHPSFVYSCIRASNFPIRYICILRIQERLHAANIFQILFVNFFFSCHLQSGRDVLVRGRVHGLRVVSKKLIFVNLRQGIHTVQCVLSEGKNTPRAMLNFT